MRGVSAAWLIALSAALLGPVMLRADPSPEIVGFADLDGWHADDHASALDGFRRTCPALDGPEWQAVCAFAETDPDPRLFFELFFRPVEIAPHGHARYTGYYEPIIRASRTRTAIYRYPVHRRPSDLPSDGPWLTRAEIAESPIMQGKEIAWLRNPADHYFLQIQGSGRLVLRDGTSLRLGFDGHNGQPFRPVSGEMVRRDIYEPHQVSSRVIRSWVGRNPDEGLELLNHDPSYVFFRVIENHDDMAGPIGAMNRPLTAGRSLAIDPRHVPLGAPVWIEKDGDHAMRRLFVAQDTGGVIKGRGRADIFFGTGEAAGRMADTVSDTGRMVVLMPIERAYAMLGQ